MSNSLAIAAVTATIRSLLSHGLGGILVSVKPPDKAREGNSDQLNLHLYHASVNAAWINRDMPRQINPGETGQPPLALNLFYLITAYGQSNEELASQSLLGEAMSLLHDHPLLGAQEIKDATNTDVPGSDLHEQIERVRITLHSMTDEEKSKLWITFQTSYRLSVAYQIGPILIESKRAAKMPLPVVARGKDDQGVASQSDLTPPFPTIEEVRLPKQKPDDFRQPSVRLDEILVIRGFQLDGTSVSAHLINQNPGLTDPPQIVPPEAGGTDREIKIKIPNQPADFPPGFYRLSLEVKRAGETFSRTTNELAFSLAPKITTNLPITVARVAGNATIALNCRPNVRPQQRVSLLLGDREVQAEAHPTSTNSLDFIVPAATPGEHFVRLRIDGVDSLLFDRTATPPVLDSTQKVKIT